MQVPTLVAVDRDFLAAAADERAVTRLDRIQRGHLGLHAVADEVRRRVQVLLGEASERADGDARGVVHTRPRVFDAANEIGEQFRPPVLLRQLVRAGKLGKKSGAGFRKFDKKGKPVADPEAAAILNKHRTADRQIPDAEIEDLLLLTMLVEATRILEEQIVASPAHVDMGLILGIGFPATRGGLLKWCDNEGAKAIVERLARYASLGKRFEPTGMLSELARKGGKFHTRAT